MGGFECQKPELKSSYAIGHLALRLPRDKGQKAEAVFFGGVPPFTQRPAKARGREREGTWPFLLIAGSGTCSCSPGRGQPSGQRSVYGAGRGLH